MLNEYERPLDDPERARLLASVRSPYAATGGASVSEILGAPKLSPGSALLMLLIGFTIVIVFWSWMIAGLTLAFYLLFISFPAYTRGKLRSRKAAAANRQQLDQLKTLLLATDKVHVQRVETDTVIEIDYGDTVVYLFDLKDGRMFWQSVDAGEAIDKAMWPNSCFEMVQIPGSDELLGPFCEGQRLQVHQSLHCLDTIELDLTDAGIVDRSIEEVLREAGARKAACIQQD